MPGWSWRLLAMLAMALAAHVWFSPLGFNPTDDGFILAQSRRILSGELPHRDFITVRPVGSAVLHVVDLWLGGGRTYLVSRLIYWLEVALACWAWLEIAISRLGVRGLAVWSLPLGALAFMLSTHAFQPMAWHTVDGVLLVSLGFLLAGRGGGPSVLAGYALIGAAAVCKQNFLPMIPLAVILQGDHTKPRAWAAALAAPVLYVATISIPGGGRDMVHQLTAKADLVQSGLHQYLARSWTLVGIAIGVLAALGARLARRARRYTTVWTTLALVLGWAIVAGLARRVDQEHFEFIDRDAFYLFGAATGVVLGSFGRRSAGRLAPAAACAIALAWCSSISEGYQTPAHAAGPLAIVLVTGLLALLDEATRATVMRRTLIIGLVAAGVVVPHWWSARRDHIAQELTAPLLTHDLAGVFPGASGIRTNANTYAALAELRQIVDGLHGRPYAILVDAPGWWACTNERNPLPADWPQSMEICTGELEERVSNRILAFRERGVVIIQNARMNVIAERFEPIEKDNGYYGAASWARFALRRESAHRYWDVYR